MTILFFPTQSTAATTSLLRAWNYGSLKTKVAAYAERSDLTSVIPDFIDYAHQEICRRLRGSLNATTADLTIDAESVALPDDFGAARRLYLDVTPRRMVNFVGPEERADISALLTRGSYPSHASIEGLNIVFAPLFGSTTTGKLLYWAIPTGFDADTDTNFVLAKYPYLYLYGSLAELFRYLEDDNNSDRYQVKFDALLDDINRKEASDQLAGGIQGRASGLVI